MTEAQRATAWRHRHGLSYDDLSKLTGYSPLAIRFFEKGVTPDRPNAKSGPHSKTSWQRFRNCCAAVDALLKTKREFRW